MLEVYSAKDSKWTLNVSVQEGPFCEAAIEAQRKGEDISNAFFFEWMGTFDDPNKIEVSSKLDACHSLIIQSGSLCASFSAPVNGQQEDDFEKVDEVAIEEDEAGRVDSEDEKEFFVI